MNLSLIKSITEQLAKLREQKPLVVNVTNYVVMNNTANALLAIGASPIMAHSRQEMAEMLSFAGALVINIGTLDEVWIERMTFAVQLANLNNKPIVIDPVGCGASVLRTQTAQQLSNLADHLYIRGNASEIMALSGIDSQSKGVDALESSEQAIHAAQLLMNRYADKAYCEVIISGETDFVINRDGVYQLNNGHEMMPYVTGMGCTHTALTGAFAALGDAAGLCATAILGIAGELAASQSTGPGSLQLNLIDSLYNLSVADIEQKLKIIKRV